ncbi:MAG: MBL fold metallo-hydrolase [Candidatus Aminicenantes bacterium]|nr:MBL fold metallo-hydrolase [Candidatus Aminicenantes bacterium]
MKKVLKLCLFTALVLSLNLHLSWGDQQKQPLQYRQEPAPVTTHQVKGHVYEAKGGSGANCGFFIGEEEVLVIDAKMNAESAKQMIAEIKKLTPHPLKYVIITHSDGDHVNGLVGFPEGITVVAHHEARKDMDQAFQEPDQRAFLPQLTFSEKLKFYLGNKVVKLFHFGPAHTSGDVVVYFPEEKVAFLGDLLFLGRDPLVHRHKKGCSFGLVKTLKKVLKLDAETFVHGHGNLASRSDIEDLIKSLEDKQAKIKALIEEEKSLDEIKQAFGVEDRPAQPGRRRWLSLVEVIYLELTEKK